MVRLSVFRALFIATAALFLSCGEGRPTFFDTSDEASTEAPIVDGQGSPAGINLTARQERAIGAVLLKDGGDFILDCTGTLIADNLVLTAGHCVEDLFPEDLAFSIGEDAARPMAGSLVWQVWLHADYDPNAFDAYGDVAILELVDPMTDAEPLAVNCEVARESALLGSQVSVVGYGATSDWDDANTARYWTKMDVVDVYGSDLVVDGYGESGMCMGDSGGPALSRVAGEVRIMGTLSWGDAECANEDHFARASSHCDFIDEVISEVEGAAPVSVTIEPLPEDDVAEDNADEVGGAESVEVEGVVFTGAEVSAVLALVNTASFEELDDDVGLDRRAATNIVDERPIADLDELGAVSYVGPAALETIRDYVSP